ncbi:MAG: dicarboxylate/amino acid:cation symporter [Treponema sp.]|jgi:proton glutamate symport protein|nr:dicarboxylate/amino acid:cation symporter [Treponema sp.]
MKSTILKHPATILVAVGTGIVIGLCNRPISGFLRIGDFAQILVLPGQLYLYYLQMTVIPIIITAIASSLGKLMRNRNAARLIKRLAVIFLLCIVSTALLGVVMGALGKPGSGLNEKNQMLLSKLISSDTGGIGAMEVSLSSNQNSDTGRAESGVGDFLKALIPANIFNALGSGSIMAIVFFSIIFGIAIGFLKKESSDMLLNLLTAIFEAFQNLISWSLYVLPFGIVCLMAGQIAQVGVGVFIAMSKFIIIYGIGTVFIFVISTLVIWINSRIANPFTVLSIVFEPILLAFATRNSMATLPSAITCLDKKLHFDSSEVNLTLPLGMTLARFGNIFYFGIAVFFVIQIYAMNLEFVHYIIILIGVIFAGTATAGASGIVTLSVISIVLDLLSLPVEAILVILMAIDAIIDPLRTFQLVYVNMAAATLIAKKNTQPTADGGFAVRNKPDALKEDAAFIMREFAVLSGDSAKTYGAGIIVNEDTYKRYRDDFEFRRLDKIVIDDVKAYDIYELYSVKGAIKEPIKKLFTYYETGLKHYFDGNFMEAYKYFDVVRKNLPNDTPSKVMSERCIRYAQKTPPS